MKELIRAEEIIKKAEEISPILGDLFFQLFTEFKVEFVDYMRVVTAGIRFSGERKIYVEKSFWEKYVKDYRDAITVFAHEILHQITFSEEKILPMDWRFENFVQDTWINSYLYKNFKLGKLFVKLYGREIPVFLLRVYDEKVEMALINRQNTSLSKKQLEQLLELWKDIYSGEKELDTMDIKIRLKKILNTIPEYFTIPIVIPCDQSCREEFKENFENSRRYNTRSLRSFWHSNTLETLKLEGVRRVKGTDQLIKEIRNYFLPEGTQRHKMYDATLITGVIPRISRISIVRLAREEYPIFYENEEVMLTGSFKNAAIYVDLSGSMDDYYGAIYFLMRKLSNFIGPPYYAFSDKVVPLGLAQLHNLEALTTYGTSFDIVIEDVKRKHIRNLIAITDGYWEIEEENLKWANRNLNIILIIPIITKEKTISNKIYKTKLKNKILIWRIS